MFISQAFATEVGSEVAATPDTGEFIINNLLIFGAIFVLFYFLFARPQQKRLKEQREVLDTLKKGDTVVTGGGLIATVSKVVSDTEVEIELGNTKVTAMRYTLQTRLEDTSKVHKPVNDVEPAAGEEKAKKAPAKKAAAAKKTTAKKSTSTKKTETKKKA